MQTKDHYLLGKYLLISSQDLKLSTKKNKLYRHAFLFGCIEPDINLISYLRGTFSNKALSGHNFNNSCNYMDKIRRKLCNTAYWSAKEYFILGRYIHYVCDSFTYAHNEIFNGTLKDHCEYEEKLHTEFLDYLSIKKPVNRKSFGIRKKLSIFGETIEKLHNEYIGKCGRPITDCRYILIAADCL